MPSFLFLILLQSSSAIRLHTSVRDETKQGITVAGPKINVTDETCDMALVPTENYVVCYEVSNIAHAECVSQMHFKFREGKSTVNCGTCADYGYPKKVGIEPLFDDTCVLWAGAGVDAKGDAITAEQSLEDAQAFMVAVYELYSMMENLGGGLLCTKNGTMTELGQMVASHGGLGQVDLLTIFSCHMNGITDCPQADLRSPEWTPPGF